MRRTTILVFALQFLTLVLAQPSPLFGEYLSGFPDCASQCSTPITDNLGFPNASIANISASLCPNLSLMRAISACIQTNCSPTDVAAAWPFQQDLCREFPIPTKAAYIRNLTIIMVSLAAIFVLLRFYSRTMVVKRFWWDDWNVAVATLFMIMIAVVMIYDSTIGLGLHAWDVESPGRLVKIAKIFFVMKLFYVIVQVLLKVSILLFYLRVFPVPWIQVMTWVLIAFTFLHGVGFFFAILLQCMPIAMLWNARIQGHCMVLKDIMFPGAILSIVEDFAILLLPIPCLSKLSVGRGKKLSLIAMFSVGMIACVTSIIRVKPVLDYRDTLDQSWDTIHILAWSEAELTVAMICVCLPSLKPILNHHVPYYFGSPSSMGFIVGDISSEPPTNRDHTRIDSFGSENKPGWFSSKMTLKTFDLFRSNTKQLNEGSTFAAGNTAERGGITIKTEIRNWTERKNTLESVSGMPSFGIQLPRTPRGILGGYDGLRMSINDFRDPWMDKVQRTRHLRQTTNELDSPLGAPGSRAEANPFKSATLPGQEAMGEIDKGSKRSKSMSESTEVPISLDQSNGSQIGEAGSFQEGSYAGSSNAGRRGRSKSDSWHVSRDGLWIIDPVRFSRFRISAFEDVSGAREEA